MSKYTTEQLRLMAKRALQAKQQRDPRYVELIMELSICTGKPLHECEERILDFIRVNA